MNIKHGSCCDLVEQKVNFWGVDIKTRQGENHLGKLIMKIRKSLQENV